MKLDAIDLIVSNKSMGTILRIVEAKIQKFPLIVVLFTQAIILMILRNLFYLAHWTITPWTFVVSQALICAFIVKRVFHLPHWLVTISVLLPVLFYVAFHYLPSASTPYGVAFVILALTFSHTLKERVPLYLTNPTTASMLQKLIAEKKAKKVMDLGSGLGGVVRAMSSEQVQSFGVESAPMLWLFSAFLSFCSRKGKILRKNIWQTNLGEYDLVYAFLSPAIMEELWEKVQREMCPGSLFISNSFVVPNAHVSEILTLEDARKTKLYLYKIK